MDGDGGYLVCEESCLFLRRASEGAEGAEAALPAERQLSPVLGRVLSGSSWRRLKNA